MASNEEICKAELNNEEYLMYEEYSKNINDAMDAARKDEVEKYITLLKEYEQWEADLINDNAMWWPNVPKDRISGNTYDKMLELQEKRNDLLKQQNS